MLKDRIALVTGAGRGIGKAIATTFAQYGANVVVNDLNEENLYEVGKEIEDLGRKTIKAIGDVSRQTDANQIIQKAIQEFGKLDILVNNAGISPKQKIDEISEQDFMKVINVNLKGTFLCSRAATEFMKAQKYGKIINLSSSTGLQGSVISGAHYSSSKAGIIGLTKTFARELAPYNVLVNAIAPGRIITPMGLGADPEKNKKVLEQVPLGRMGTAQEVANAALFLASDLSSYITGICLNVSGGWIMF